MPSPGFPLRTLAVLTFFSLLASAHAADSYVRVNQVGYEVGLSARAYVMTTKSVADARFSITDAAGNAIVSGSLGSQLGTWGKFDVYPIDFILSQTGTYVVSLSHGLSGASAAFRVDSPRQLYATPLTNNLYFYENERDGRNFIPTPLRSAPGHLNDSKAKVFLSPAFDDDDNIVGSLVPTGATVNAEGGWWDAGDYLKFVQTQSYVVALMMR